MNIKDEIVRKVVNNFIERSNVGIKKYGTTLEENNKDDFLQHLKEELMDAVLYIEKLQNEVQSQKETTTATKGNFISAKAL